MRTRTIAVVGLLAGALFLTACGNADDPTVAGSDDAASASQAQFNDADVAFVAGMVPHHTQAVEMADMILDKDPSEPVASLANKIKSAQQPEIDQLESMLETFGEDSAKAGGHGGGHDGGSSGSEHAGMMSDTQMQQLEQANGAEAERMFLTLMIEHHRGAIQAADTELADGEHRPALDLANTIRDDQAAEIAEMEQLLSQL